MSSRSIVISDTARLNNYQNNLVVTNNEEEVRIPLEDIATILLDSTRSVITTSLLSKANEYGIGIITTDDKHLPSGILLPLNQHYSQLERVNSQISQTVPFKKQVWQKIIISKVTNQSICLSLLNQFEGAEHLLQMSSKVKSGDNTHIESLAARYYFQYLFGTDFSRRDDSELNKALNYGYSIIRSAIARELVVCGFVTSLGIHHCNQFNNFNLADDFIEPYRPLVDMWAFYNMRPDVVFSKYEKYRLVALLNHAIRHNNMNTSVYNSIRASIQSYVSSLNARDPSLLTLPELIRLKIHNYE